MSEIEKEFHAKGVEVVAGTIDQTGKPALENFAAQFHPMFAIGYIDPSLVYSFGQYGMQTRTFVPMLFLIDKTGVVRAQFMGSDPIFGDSQLDNLRAAVNHLMATSPTPAAAKKK